DRWAGHEQHPDKNAGNAADHEGQHGAAHRVVEILKQAVGDEDLFPHEFCDAARSADQDRIDELGVGGPLPEIEEHGEEDDPRGPDLPGGPTFRFAHWVNPSSSLLQTCEYSS